MNWKCIDDRNQCIHVRNIKPDEINTNVTRKITVSRKIINSNQHFSGTLSWGWPFIIGVRAPGTSMHRSRRPGSFETIEKLSIYYCFRQAKIIRSGQDWVTKVRLMKLQITNENWYLNVSFQYAVLCVRSGEWYNLLALMEWENK